MRKKNEEHPAGHADRPFIPRAVSDRDENLTRDRALTTVPIIETRRLVLRGFKLTDFEPYAQMWASAKVVRFIGGMPLSRETTWTRLFHKVRDWDQRGFGMFAIEERATRRFIGESGFQDPCGVLRSALGEKFEARWAISPEAQGNSYAEEAMRATLSWADRAWPEQCIACLIRADHFSSLHIAKKLAFVESGRVGLLDRTVIIFERDRASDAVSRLT